MKFSTSQVLSFRRRFASRLAAFPAAGRQAALRALTKPVQLAAAPTIASQVRGHAGQTMQELIMKIWGQCLFEEMFLHVSKGRASCMLMDVDTKKLSNVWMTLGASLRQDLSHIQGKFMF